MRAKPMCSAMPNLRLSPRSARDQLVLDGTEVEEGLQLKLAELARDLALAQMDVCSLALPLLLLSSGPDKIRPKNRTAMLVKSTAY